ncbi:vacuolar protein sorting-associated protein VTA1 homolog isoform X3 [Seriola lalandi dorsalis]|uniref:Vacuolar protein sorting-associated protein VTA1 homolog n=2 Tax=Seriola TaxID=8160 RepID=A0A3B4T9I7_SERDU|nr:vacuolar protein sorting-associated protein VTA1 homolog isoform X3 [Seriola dumerili]XP_023266854.1 vacuolar protein sorting-associated protein VTA1 homolog isoform X3 [Seriola lalandi dorsalis]XP_056261135.1 vacuolar protein sorting-associated protein VTA1 homolog isoform X3 [Seriola aureovittata]
MALPAQLKPIQHHLRTAQEHDKRDPVVAYYCRLFAMQTGMKLDSKTPECRKFLVKLMDQLESMKKELSDNDSISQEVVGNAHIENYALKMFIYADNEDRGGRFHKNMIKSFYTASLLLDVLSVFGELSEENIQHRKYARWKATYIHNCLKNGETPQAGPIAMDEDGEADEFGAEGFSGPGPSHGGSFRGGPPSQPYDDQDKSLGPGPAPGIGFSPSPGAGPSGPPTTSFNNIHIPPGAHAPANTPAELPPPTGGVQLSPDDFTKAQKYCKYAGSALQYEDVGTAIQNLQKALKLLTTGKE